MCRLSAEQRHLLVKCTIPAADYRGNDGGWNSAAKFPTDHLPTVSAIVLASPGSCRLFTSYTRALRMGSLFEAKQRAWIFKQA